MAGKLDLSSTFWSSTGQALLAANWKSVILPLLFILAQLTLATAEVEMTLTEEQSGGGSVDDLLTFLQRSAWSGDIQPSRSKKHIGSVAAASGMRRPSHEELDRFNAQMHGIGQPLSFKRGIPPTLRKYFFGQGPLVSSNTGSGFRNKKSGGSSDDAEGIFDQALEPMGAETLPSDEFPYGEASLESRPSREKRFMGHLARGGWFPREFRGYVSSPQWDKRHVGAFARLGWMPHSKVSRQGDDGFKRNLGSLRRNQIWIPKEERTWEE